MSLTVYLSGHLKPFSGGKTEVGLDGEHQTLGDALDELWARHPALRDRVMNEQGEIRTHVNIFVNGDSVKRHEGLGTRIDDKEIHIFNAVSGG